MPVHAGELIQDAYEVISGDGLLDFDGQHCFGEDIGDAQNLQHPPVAGLVEREVQPPHMVRELRS